MSNPPYPPELREAWARVIAYAWLKGNEEFLTRLRKDPKETVTNVVKSREPYVLTGPCSTIQEYVDNPESEEGFFALPNLPAALQDLTEDQLYAYANQDGIFGIMRVS